MTAQASDAEPVEPDALLQIVRFGGSPYYLAGLHCLNPASAVVIAGIA
ncbi:hypothetical protein [Planomonospora sp. ID82291]|nr:hypothetical protein [Planomonospora sp. ID82291]MBG0818896.1 hypothetical protein [Planomonospora sp. ID82291]